MEFNEKLQKLRTDERLTQEELAEKLYVSRTAISKWESGRGYPSIDSLKVIAKYFHITIDELICGEEIIEEKDFLSDVCKAALSAASDVDLQFLKAMAEDEGSSKMTDIASRMHVKRDYAQRYKVKMTESGIIFRFGAVKWNMQYHFLKTIFAV